MTGMGALVLALLLYLSLDLGIWCVHGGTVGEAFLDLLEKQVRQIADQAVTNKLQDCHDLVSSCSGSCSREECKPLSTDLDNSQYDCLKFPGLGMGCAASNSSTGGVQGSCDSVRATFSMGYVRTPYEYKIGSPIEIRESICKQRMLDATFQKATAELRQGYKDVYFHSYFGSVSGDFRYFPGREVLNCTARYDPRLRPWYTNAISVVKNMVVLLDNGGLMAERPALESDSAFAVAKNITELLLNGSLTKGDNITFVLVNSSGPSSVTQALVNDSVPAASIQNVVAALRGAVDPTTNDGDANLAAGLQLARSKFNSTDNSTNCKVVVVLTDRSNHSENANFTQAVNDLLALDVKLFIYTVGLPLAGNTQNATCLYHYEGLDAVGLRNPLFGLKYFFSYLAQFRQEASNGIKPHWQSLFLSSTRSGLGDIISVAFPALANNDLIGVAGIDVQKSALLGDTDLSDSVKDALAARERIALPNIPAPNLRCQETNTTTENCGTIPPAICPKNITTMTSNLDLICCQGCGITSTGDPPVCGGTGQPSCAEPSPVPQPGPGTSGCGGSEQSRCTTPSPADRGGGPPIKIIVPVVLTGFGLLALSSWYLKKRYTKADTFADPVPNPGPNLNPIPENKRPPLL